MVAVTAEKRSQGPASADGPRQLVGGATLRRPMAPGPRIPGRLRGRTIAQIEEELMARYLYFIKEEEIAERILRRGWVHIMSDLRIQDWEVTGHEVTTKASQQNPPVPDEAA